MVFSMFSVAKKRFNTEITEASVFSVLRF